MAFRGYMLLLLASLIVLFTRCWIVGAAGILFTIILWPITGINNYKSWKKSNSKVKRSLSFGMKSIIIQKQNFKAIDFVFSKIPLLQIFNKSFFKKMSVVFDDMHVKRESNRTRSTFNDSYQRRLSSPQCAHLVSNIWHESKW